MSGLFQEGGLFDADPEFRAIDREMRRLRRARHALFAGWLLLIVTIIAWAVTHPGAIGGFIGRIAAGFSQGVRP